MIMKPEEYLNKVLAAHSLDNDGSEIREIRSQRKVVEEFLRSSFPKSTLTIRYSGSKAKGTMVLDSYDLDVICYFLHDDNEVGDSLKDIYERVYGVLSDKYYVEQKRSALRLRSKDSDKQDFHIDVVPGRFVDDTLGDTYLYQKNADKERLKTNLDIHISHIAGSERTDIIQLGKVWKIRNGIDIKTFALELLIVKYAENKEVDHLRNGLTSFWEYLRDHSDSMTIEDPANPSGNDLSLLLNDGLRETLRIFATSALDLVEQDKWPSIFGDVETMPDEEKTASLMSYASSISSMPQPWTV